MAVDAQILARGAGGVRSGQQPGQREERRRRLAGRAVVAAGVLVVLAGLALRFYAPTALWLDETISVNIAALPLARIPAALRQDGAPPLYYVLLHFWMQAFGRSDIAVRALSGVVSVVSLPAFWFAGRRLGGRRIAWITFFCAVSSPFALYYATTTRMYSLMVLWAVLGFIALGRALDAPTPRRLVVLCALTAAILYTHYWGLYLVGVTGLWLLYQMWRHRRQLPVTTDAAAVRRCFVAMFVGGLLFLPWAPTFLFQAAHTGTPWTAAASPADLLGIFNDYAGAGPWAELLGFLYFGLLVLGVFGRRPPEHEVIDLDREAAGAVPVDGLEDPQVGRSLRARLRAAQDRAVGFAGFGPGGAGAPRREQGITLVLQPNRRALPVFGVLLGTLVVAVIGGVAVNAAFVARYAAVVLPLFLMLVALGLGVLSRPRLVTGTLAVISVAGLLTGLGNNAAPRTQAVQVAQVLNAQAQPGDLVVFCPDQLGPAVNRLVTVPGLTELTFPRAIGPQRVDWVDYKKVIGRTNVEAFAQDMRAALPPGKTLWLVWRNGYPGLGGDCGALATWLDLFQGQGATVVNANASFYEYENLTRYPTG